MTAGGSCSSVGVNISQSRGNAGTMSKDRTSVKPTKSEALPVSTPSEGAERTAQESLKRYAYARRLHILTADEGKALVELAKKAGWKPLVRPLGYGVSVRVGPFEVAVEA